MITILKIALSICDGCMGGWIGLQADLKRAQSPEERRYLIRLSSCLAIAILVVVALQFAAAPWLPRPWPAVLMGGLLVTTTALARTDERLTEIESRFFPQAGDSSRDDAPAERSRLRGSNRRSMIIGALGGIMGANSWVVLVFMKTIDWIALGIVVLACCAAGFRVVRRLPDAPENLQPRAGLRLISAPLVPLGCLGLLIIHFRAAGWQALPAGDLEMVKAINVAMIIMGTVILLVDQWQKFARQNQTDL